MSCVVAETSHSQIPLATQEKVITCIKDHQVHIAATPYNWIANNMWINVEIICMCAS